MAMARPEVTGKKPAPTNDGPKYRRKPKSADPQALAMSIHAFCVRHDISEDLFFKMQREGWGPRVMRVPPSFPRRANGEGSQCRPIVARILCFRSACRRARGSYTSSRRIGSSAMHEPL